MATSNAMNTSNQYVKYTISINQNSRDIENNKSNVTVSVRFYRTNTGYETYGTGTVYCKINGTQYSAAVAHTQKITNSGIVLFTKTLDIPHNADGKKTLTCSAWINLNTPLTSSEQSYSQELTTIPRKATLTSAPNFNDEENPTITYSNPAGTAVSSLKACIASADGVTAYVPYRDISKTGTSYTFNLTADERNALRNATKNSNTLAVKFYVETAIGGGIQEPRSNLQKTLTIKNPNPTLNPTVVDEGVNSLKLTGDANKIIKYFNNVKVNSGGAAVKGASIVSQKVVCGNKSISSGSGYFSNAESANFVFSITDSRGNTTTKTITKTLINYVKLTCNLSASNPTLNNDGKTATAQLKISGNYFNGSFGAVANTLAVQYRVKVNNGSYGDWINATATKSGNTYAVTINKADLNYQDTYTFQARVQDEVQKTDSKYVVSAEKKIKTIPVFDWGENDFQFNVDALDKNGNKIGTEITSASRSALCISGKELKESGFVSITPVANTPTKAKINYKRTYKNVPIITLSCVAGNPEQILGYSLYNQTTSSVEIVLTRTNTSPTNVYYFIYGEVAE